MRGANRFPRVAGYGAGVLIAAGIVTSAAFRPGGVPVTVLVFFALGILTFGYLIWRLVTGRDGLWRRGPTRRRLDRLARRAAAAEPDQR